MSEVLGDNCRSIEINKLVNRAHYAELHQFRNDLACLHAQLMREFADGNFSVDFNDFLARPNGVGTVHPFFGPGFFRLLFFLPPDFTFSVIVEKFIFPQHLFFPRSFPLA